MAGARMEREGSGNPELRANSVAIVVLHGFIKKSQQTSVEDLALARKRNREFEP